MNSLKLRKNLALLKESRFRSLGEKLLYKISATRLSTVFYYSRFFILKFSVPENDSILGLSSIKTRIAIFEDIDRLNQLFLNVEYAIRFKRGDVCVIAENKDNIIIGMEWLQFNKDQEGGQDYKISIPTQSIWLHDGYVQTVYRLRGIWVNLMSGINNFCRKNAIREAYTIIYSGNQISINTHIRYGYKFNKEVIYIRLLGINIHKEKDMSVDPPRIKLYFSFSLKRN